MKRMIVVMMLVGIILMSVGCKVTHNHEFRFKTKKSYYGTTIKVDKETGVNYIVVSSGISPLYDSEGNIVIDKQGENE